MEGARAAEFPVFTPGKLAFIPYVMAGDPDVETTREIVEALAEAGAAAIELGIPYGDPLADGPTIAAAGIRALREGTSLQTVLRLVNQMRGSVPPIVLFTYFNPVYRYGIERFAEDAASAGAAGAIVPDLSLEEAEPARAALLGGGLVMPLLVAPSTGRSRAERIAGASTGFVYVVSRLGVTGAASSPDFSPLRTQISMLRSVTEKPLAVGFGISSKAHVDEVRGIADGIVVGSAVIDAYAGTRGSEAASRVKRFAEKLLRD